MVQRTCRRAAGFPATPDRRDLPGDRTLGKSRRIGTGYAFDFKHGVLVATAFSYTQGGEAQWYIASGPIVGATFISRLDKFVGGPCLGCAYAGGPMSAGSDGTITILFSSPASATVYLPRGRVTQIQPVPF